MQAENNLEKQISIDFPKPLFLHQAEQLLEKVAGSLNAEISYNVSYYCCSMPKNGYVQRDRGVALIVAQIADGESYESIRIVNSEKDSHRLARMERHRDARYTSADQEFWRKLKKAVELYFAENKF